MPMEMESVDGPALLEWRDVVAQRLRAMGGGATAEEMRRMLREVCFTILVLVLGDHGRVTYLTSYYHPALWAHEEDWLNQTARLFADVITAVRRHHALWLTRFWASGGALTQWDAYHDAALRGLAGVFVDDVRQRALASGVGEADDAQ